MYNSQMPVHPSLCPSHSLSPKGASQRKLCGHNVILLRKLPRKIVHFADTCMGSNPVQFFPIYSKRKHWNRVDSEDVHFKCYIVNMVVKYVAT